MMSIKPNPPGLHESPNSIPENISPRRILSIAVPEMMAFLQRLMTLASFRFR
jgi:hypothetical protein